MELVLKDAALLVSAGLIAGIFGSLALAQAATPLLFETPARDPLRIAGACLALAAAAAIGSMVPARHASRLDPMNALRDE
jgi:ABC-type antimicrobial peptide transport system permease subunit